MGIFAAEAKFKPSLDGKSKIVNFILKDGNFLKNNASAPSKYNTVNELVAVPFNSEWRYRSISGRIEPTDNGIKVTGFKAESDSLNFFVDGELLKSGNIDCKVVIYFSPGLTSRIPPEFVNMIMTEEKDGWRSLSVIITGDPQKPSIQVKSKSFRLSIKSVSGY